MHQADGKLNAMAQGVQVDVSLTAHVPGRTEGHAMHVTRSILALIAIAGLAGAASAGPRCDVSLDRWQSRQALEEKLRSEGWRVARVRSDDGCYKVEGTRADGQRVKATVQPNTLTIIRERRSDD